MTCPKCKGEITISEPFDSKGFGWFAGAICKKCNIVYAEVRHRPTAEDAEKRLFEMLGDG